MERQKKFEGGLTVSSTSQNFIICIIDILLANEKIRKN